MNRFQGDPAINMKPDGASMKFISGQPVMDQGLENAAIISLFTKPGFWGNILFKKQSEKIGSDFETNSTKPIIDLQSINDTKNAANNALKWMIDVKLANRIDIDVINPHSNFIETNILISPPGRDIQNLLFLKNGINWILQATNPAYERF